MSGSGRIVVAAGRSLHGARALQRGVHLANTLDRPLVVWSVIPEREARSIQFLSRDAGASEVVQEQFGERLKAETLGLGGREESLSIEVRVGDPGCVAKSWPTFWEDLEAAGAEVV